MRDLINGRGKLAPEDYSRGPADHQRHPGEHCPQQSSKSDHAVEDTELIPARVSRSGSRRCILKSVIVIMYISH